MSEIKLEKAISKDSSLIRDLKFLNHRLNFVSSMNRVDAILIKNNQLFGGAAATPSSNTSYLQDAFGLEWTQVIEKGLNRDEHIRNTGKGAST